MSARGRELLLAYERADAERRALGAKPECLRQPGEVKAAWARTEAAHREWQADVRTANTETWQ